MAGRVQRARRDRAQHEVVAVLEQPVELTAVALEIRAGVEDLAEHVLHDGDVPADGEQAADLALQVGRCREVVGMDVGLEDPLDLEPMLPHERDHAVGRVAVRVTGGGIVVQHRVDERASASWLDPSRHS